MATKELPMCFHPELRPTQWEQKRPAPTRMVGCEHNYSCPVCRWGVGSTYDPCGQGTLAVLTGRYRGD